MSKPRSEAHQQKGTGRFFAQNSRGYYRRGAGCIDRAVCGNLAHFYPTVYLMDFRNFTFCNEKCAFLLSGYRSLN